MRRDIDELPREVADDSPIRQWLCVLACPAAAFKVTNVSTRQASTRKAEDVDSQLPGASSSPGRQAMTADGRAGPGEPLMNVATSAARPAGLRLPASTEGRRGSD